MIPPSELASKNQHFDSTSNDAKWNILSKRIRRVEMILTFFGTVFVILFIPVFLYFYTVHIHTTYGKYAALDHQRNDYPKQEFWDRNELIQEILVQVNRQLSPPLSSKVENTVNENIDNHLNLDERKDENSVFDSAITNYNENQDMAAQNDKIAPKKMDLQEKKTLRNTRISKYNRRTNSQEREEKVFKPATIIPAIIHKDQDLNAASHRSLQVAQNEDETTSISCDKTLIRIEIQLDDFLNETAWELFDETAGLVIYRQNFTFLDGFDDDDQNALMDDDMESIAIVPAAPFSTQVFTACLEPGPYTFTIYDSFWDGIACGHPIGCYKIFLNDQLAFRGKQFVDREDHFFDSSSTECTSGFKVRLEINPEYYATGMTWKFFHKGIFTTPELSQDLASNGKIVFDDCLLPGLYSLDIFEGDGSSSATDVTCNEDGICYEVFINHMSIINGTESIGHQYHEFYISKEGRSREQHCYKLPKLSPANHLNKFVFDQSISQTLSVITSLSSMDMLQDQYSPQYYAACWIIYDDVLHLAGLSPFLVERYTLAVFFFATKQNIESLQKETCYLDIPNVVCNEDNHVIKLDYWETVPPLTGFIPSEIGLLLKLENIDFGGNKLTGSIPREMGRLSLLRTFIMDENNLSGTIPWEIGNLQRLEELDLVGNNLHGQIPSEIGQCSRLQRISFRQNQLEGSLPSTIFDCLELRTLNMGNNALNGTLSSHIGNLKDLTWLTLENNHFSGSLPIEIWNLTKLTDFNIDTNRFTGSISDQARQLTLLEWFDVDSNTFVGGIPNIFSDMPKLMHLDLSNNNFTGELPDSMWDLAFEDFFLFENDLVGEVPDEFCENVEVELRVDNSPWFSLQPKVKCDCCDDSLCYMWDNGFSPARPCPEKNIYERDFVQTYFVVDKVSNFTFVQRAGFEVKKRAQICVSPLGCYNAEFQVNSDGSRVGSFIPGFNVCGSIDICETSIEATGKKREGLNHITQFVPPDISNLNNQSIVLNQALCWIMSEDKLMENFSICDGTLLQRFVLVYFYLSQSFDTELQDLALNHTCDWPGITCDSKKKFVTELSFPQKGLQGQLITEIGYLTTMKKIDLSNNTLNGTIDPSLYNSLLSLELFDVSSNELEGDIPMEMLTFSDLKHFNISNNKFVGTLSNDVVFSKSLEIFDVENNLFQGAIPNGLLQVRGLQSIVVSRNNFGGTIPRGIGKMPNIKVVKFDQNIFEGSIPVEIFNSKQIEILQFQDNRLTGSIPIQIGNLENATTIIMSHNFFKGTIPLELEKLRKLNTVHFHQNRLAGLAPKIIISGESRNENYITDCGDPNYLLDEKITCVACTMCCNSMQRCQISKPEDISIGFIVILVIVTPIILAILLSAAWKLQKFCGYLLDSREPMTVYNDDSVYCFILSNDNVARLLYGATVFAQVLLFSLYLDASKFERDDTDWLFSYRCLGNSLECKLDKSSNFLGTTLFFVVTILYLGSDLVISFLQIRKSVALLDMQLLLSGSILFALTFLATLTSYRYNTALAEKNTDWITNSMILLFVNELDEKVLSVMEAIVPEWTEKVLGEVEQNMATKVVVRDDPNVPIMKTYGENRKDYLEYDAPTDDALEGNSGNEVNDLREYSEHDENGKNM